MHARSRAVASASARTGIVAAPHRWLLLIHQLPARPSNLRVQTWRRLQQLGAMPVKQAVYVLPDSPTAREDFEWLKTEIEAGGGQASLFAADTVDGRSSDELMAEFRSAREHDYITLARAIERVTRTERRKRTPRRSRRATARTIEAFRQRLAAVESIDFFGSAGRDRVAALLTELQRTLSAEASPASVDSSSEPASREGFRRRLWVTRPRPGIDRMASAWLIRRFIDPDADFDFVEHAPTAGHAIPFDMFGVKFTHRGEWCTFETLAHTFAISDSAVERLAAVVHDLDLKDGKFGVLETAAIGALVDGLQALYPDDRTLLDNGMTMFEALYRAFQREARRPGPRGVAQRRTKSRR